MSRSDDQARGEDFCGNRGFTNLDLLCSFFVLETQPFESLLIPGESTSPRWENAAIAFSPRKVLFAYPDGLLINQSLQPNSLIVEDAVLSGEFFLPRDFMLLAHSLTLG